jgi:hypothetical protein
LAVLQTPQRLILPLPAEHIAAAHTVCSSSNSSKKKGMVSIGQFIPANPAVFILPLPAEHVAAAPARRKAESASTSKAWLALVTPVLQTPQRLILALPAEHAAAAHGAAPPAAIDKHMASADYPVLPSCKGVHGVHAALLVAAIALVQACAGCEKLSIMLMSLLWRPHADAVPLWS